MISPQWCIFVINHKYLSVFWVGSDVIQEGSQFLLFDIVKEVDDQSSGNCVVESP